MLAGIAVRIGQKLGLHRDGAELGISPLDTEVRRRVWWNAIILDGRSAEVCGCGHAVTGYSWDVKLPLNVNDSDLHPGMREPPVEHSGSTEMIFCLTRCEVGIFLRRLSANSGFDGYWQKLSSSTVPIEDKDRAIDELEQTLERRFVRHCDPVIPLHFITIGIARMSVSRMRLRAHHPRQHKDHEASLHQQEQDSLFVSSLKMMEYENSYLATFAIQKYIWFGKMHFNIDGFVYLLDALRKRTSGELVDRAWVQVADSYRFRPELLTDTRNHLFAAIRNLTMAAYDSREADPLNGHLIPAPEFIQTLRSIPRRSKKSSAATPNEDASKVDYPQSVNQEHRPGHDQDPSPPSQLDTTDLSPMDWAYWDDLLKGAEMADLGNIALSGEGEAGLGH